VNIDCEVSKGDVALNIPYPSLIPSGIVVDNNRMDSGRVSRMDALLSTITRKIVHMEQEWCGGISFDRSSYIFHQLLESCENGIMLIRCQKTLWMNENRETMLTTFGITNSLQTSDRLGFATSQVFLEVCTRFMPSRDIIALS
jgi:hypothetical protein